MSQLSEISGSEPRHSSVTKRRLFVLSAARKKHSTEAAIPRNNSPPLPHKPLLAWDQDSTL